MSIHVNFYLEQSAVTLIQRVQHSKNRLGAETIAALLQTHHSWNALPDRNHVQCERFNPLTWVRKKIRTAIALQTEYVWNRSKQSSEEQVGTLTVLPSPRFASKNVYFTPEMWFLPVDPPSKCDWASFK